MAPLNTKAVFSLSKAEASTYIALATVIVFIASTPAVFNALFPEGFQDILGNVVGQNVRRIFGDIDNYKTYGVAFIVGMWAVFGLALYGVIWVLTAKAANYRKELYRRGNFQNQGRSRLLGHRKLVKFAATMFIPFYIVMNIRFFWPLWIGLFNAILGNVANPEAWMQALIGVIGMASTFYVAAVTLRIAVYTERIFGEYIEDSEVVDGSDL